MTIFTPLGFKKWSRKRYRRKLYKLAKTISEIGRVSSHLSPVLIGIAEVENKSVINDLIKAEPIRAIDYGIVHYDSPDERGIDTALIYDKLHLEVVHSEPITLLLFNSEGIGDTTRCILYVHGKLNGEAVHIFVNHWPSRRDGVLETNVKRVKATETIKSFMDKIELRHQRPKYIIMGDFNGGPKSVSIQNLMQRTELFNTVELLLTDVRGSANYKQKWKLFDQIIVSNYFFTYEKGTHSFAHANIFDNRFLTEIKGRFKGFPFRTFARRKYLGGYSDHFPGYNQLKYNP